MAKSFSWEKFSIDFIKSIVFSGKTAEDKRAPIMIDDKDFLIPFIDDICTYPNASFVRKYRREIEDYFLDESNSLISIVKKLENVNYSDVKFTGNNKEMLDKLKSKRLTQTILDAYISEIRLQGSYYDEEESIFKMPKIINLKESKVDDVPLYSYQKNAVQALKNYFISDDKKSGILVMPTGSGKTRTSVYFLLKEMISRGYQVVWIAHRHMLIEQTAQNFYKFSPLIKTENEDKNIFRMICISGKHAKAKAMTKEDDLIISSVQSLNKNNLVYIPNILREKVMIIVDEAHHTSAPSYRKIINKIREKVPAAKLLGLTATPCRLTDEATRGLMKIFDNQVIYSISMSKLIADGVLAKPNYINIETNIDIDTIIDIDERAYIKKWGEMPASLLTKVAKTNKRNEIIIDEYMKNRKKYGKTIIFALNAIHCIALSDELNKRGIKCEYIYCLNKDNEEIIERFKNSERKDSIDVLVNINMLTEGSDIPDIQTVFLTRPTSSDTLLMQMVGRGMRGKSQGGTETVNIIDFCDKWNSITRWLNPKFLLDNGTGMIEDDVEYDYTKCETIPVAMVRDLIKGIKYIGASIESRNVVLPIGWYDLKYTKILVFQNQVEGYKKLKKSIDLQVKNGVVKSYITSKNFTVNHVLYSFFSNFGIMPNKQDLNMIFNYIYEEEDFPQFFEFEQRDKIDPYKIAKEIINDPVLNYSKDEKIDEIYNQNKSIIDNLYENKENYKKMIMNFTLYPKGCIHSGIEIEETSKKTYGLSPRPINQALQTLLSEVIEEQGSNLFDGFKRPEIKWTDKPYKSYFACYYKESNLIEINALLNSKSIKIEVLKFIIYHECLHQEFPYHTPEFRHKERMYPNFNEYEYFLDYKLKDFDIEYAL